jgi:hypothetical protein
MRIIVTNHGQDFQKAVWEDRKEEEIANFRASYEDKSFFQDDEQTPVNRSSVRDNPADLADKLMRITEQMSDKEGSLRGTKQRNFFGTKQLRKQK